MTPSGFNAWLKDAGPGQQIIYWQGRNLSESGKARTMCRVVREAYEKGLVTLVCKREAPAQGVNKHTVGRFAWIAIRRAQLERGRDV